MSATGYGGIYADTVQIRSIWKQTVAGYRTALGELCADAAAHLRDIDDSVDLHVRAGELAMTRGEYPTARLITGSLARTPATRLTEEFIGKTRLIDPLVGVTAELLPGGYSIALEATGPQDRIEESLLFEAIVSAAETKLWRPGYGAVFIERVSGGERLVWQVGDGLAAIGGHTRAQKSQTTQRVAVETGLNRVSGLVRVAA